MTSSIYPNSGGCQPAKFDAVIIGSGLAGLAVALHALDRGAKIAIIEKETKIGGNTIKASSGVNGVSDLIDSKSINCIESLPMDSISMFEKDTIAAAGSSAQPEMIHILVNNSSKAIEWLKSRVGVSLDSVGQLGGHTVARTYRPTSSTIGWDIVTKMQTRLGEFSTDCLSLMVNTKLVKVLQDDNDQVIGVRYEHIDDNGTVCRAELYARSVIICTGGFAADRSSNSLLAKYQPQWLNMGTTAGDFSKGEGIIMCEEIRAQTIDMDKVQIHPTGFVDPKDPSNPHKFLAAEILRGVGGILLDHNGRRFCNELGTRAYVTDCMLAHVDENYRATGQWKQGSEVPTYFLLLSKEAVRSISKHMEFYEWKGLMIKVCGIDQLVNAMGLSNAKLLKETLVKYAQNADMKTSDEFGKSIFQNVPTPEDDLYYVGTVSPVLHYCMGGIKVNAEGCVLNSDDQVISGLFACGEVVGGVHGDSRLGGNSLLECAVFGAIIGQQVPIHTTATVTKTK